MTHQEDIPPCLIFIDKEGRWYHKGAEMIRRDFIQLFYRSMVLDGHGRYLINWQGKTCYVEVADTAFVVKRVSYEPGPPSCFMLSLSDGTQEALAPDTLWVGKDHVLYCRVKEKTFPARFLRSAYYQLSRHVKEEAGTFFITLNGVQYPISNTG